MSLLPVGISGEAAYTISRSLRFNSSDSSYLNRTPASAGNRKTWTWSGWVKVSSITSDNFLFSAYSGASGDGFRFRHFSTATYPDSLMFYLDDTNGGTVYTNAVFRDVSAWYHIVFAVDTTQATAANRIKFYVNGTEQTFASATYPTQNYDCRINNNVLHNIGAVNGGTFFNGYLTEINFIDGQALTPSSFGETNPTTGVWQPKKYTGTYGTNGFYLNFSDNSGTTSTTLGKDSSGNGNNWTPNNFSVTAGAGNDSLVDTPTNYGTDTGLGGQVRANYCTWNPIDKQTSITLNNGNLFAQNTTSSYQTVRSTISVNSGKWYFEATCDSISASPDVRALIGVMPASNALPVYLGELSGQYGYLNDGQVFSAGSGTAGNSTYQTGDVIGVALNMDAGTVTFYKNGVSQTNGGTGLSGFYNIALSLRNVNGTVASVTANFGQRPFAYTAPSGFKALCTQNLPEPTIVDGGQYFNTVLYTGNGSTQSITGVGFQPDLVWIKSRSNAVEGPLFDVLRGTTKGLFSSRDLAEFTDATTLTAFNSGGFTVAGNTHTNLNNYTYVAWNWKANGAGSTNTAGTITSTVSVNTTSGFSIVTYTGNGTSGATVGHGLGVAPSMVIVKRRDGVVNWIVYHISVGAAKYIQLNTTGAEELQSSYNMFNSTAPSSSVITLGNLSNTNTNGSTYVAYCFANISGYSQAFSFSGNGSTDGSFVFLGFRPAWVLIKRTDTTSNWTILDFQREGYNVDNDPLYPNLSNAEGTTDLADLLSNGFKLRTTDASVNASGGTYIGFAVAQNPFKYSLGR